MGDPGSESTGKSSIVSNMLKGRCFVITQNGGRTLRSEPGLSSVVWSLVLKAIVFIFSGEYEKKLRCSYSNLQSRKSVLLQRLDRASIQLGDSF